VGLGKVGRFTSISTMEKRKGSKEIHKGTTQRDATLLLSQATYSKSQNPKSGRILGPIVNSYYHTPKKHP